MKIQDLLNQSKPCWKYAAMDCDGLWYLFTDKPFLHKGGVWINNSANGRTAEVGYAFVIEPFDGDWKDSLIEREE